MNISEYQNYHETKIHTASDFPYNTYLCSIPLDFTHVPTHWHEEMELIVIKKGQGHIFVDLHKYDAYAGNIIVILPGCLHSISEKPGQSMEYENIIFNPRMLISGKNDLCSTHFIEPLMQRSILIETFLCDKLSYYPEVISCINHVDILCAAQPDGYQLALKGRLFQMIFLLITHKKQRDAALKYKTKSLEKIKTVLKFMEEHYAEPITITEMAGLCYFSKSHFMKFFKANMGMGFTEYLNDYRLTMAARLLATSSATILEIAGQTGFDNLSYFNRLFKRKFSETPSQYRKAGSIVQ